MSKKLPRRVQIQDPISSPEPVNGNVDWKLLLACTLRDVPIAREALSQGANVNSRRSDYLTPLHIAVLHDDTELIELLCDHPSINIDARTLDGLTPLHKAALLGHNRSMEELIHHDAMINCKDNLGRYPLHYSALRKDIRSATILILYGAFINVYDDFHESPLYTSVIRRPSLNMAKLLLCYGATISLMPDKLSLGIFLEAILCARNASDMEIVDLLYRNGADVNTADFIGLRTPLHITAMTGNIILTAYLIEKGADINRKSKAGYTPMDVAAMCRNFDIVQLMRGVHSGRD